MNDYSFTIPLALNLYQVSGQFPSNCARPIVFHSIKLVFKL